jgi:hypothetical protein
MAQPGKPLEGAEAARWWQETGEFELRQILYWRWDPIGVDSAFPWTADEYDRYAPHVAESLKEASPAEALAEQLRLIETDRMALTDSVEAAARRRKVAAAIVKWYDDSQTRWRRFGARSGS